MPVPTITGTVTDPEFRRERARIAGIKAQSTDNLVDRVVRRADELTPDHIEKLRALLPPAADDSDDEGA